MNLRLFLRGSPLATLLILLSTAPGIPLTAQSIDSLLQLAIESDPVVESVELRTSAIRERSRGMEAWDPPRVGARISMLPPSEPNPFAAGETMVMAEQDIPLGGKRRRMAAAELAMIPVEEVRVDLSRRDLRREITGPYITIWEIDRRIELNRENRTLLEKIYEEGKSRFALSNQTSATLYNLAAEIEKLDAERERLLSSRRESVVTINIVTGRPLDLPIEVILPEPVDELPSFEELLPLLSSHPALLRMDRMAEARERMAESRDAELEPTLMLSAGVNIMPDGHPVRSRNLSRMVGEIGGAGTQGNEHGEILGLSFGGMLSIPTASWSRSSAEGAGEADRLESLALRSERSGMLRDMAAELRALLGRAERAEVMERYFDRKQIPLLEKEIEVLRIEYLAGRTPLSDLLDSYRMLLMVREEIIMRRAERFETIEMIEIMTGMEVTR